MPLTRLGLVLWALLAWQPVQALNELSDPASEWRFKVQLDDREIGFHRFKLSQSGARETIQTEARFAVKLLFITAYDYEHSNTEIWEDGCLQSISANTNDNGDRYALQGLGLEDGFRLELNEQSENLEAKCVSSFAYWNPGIVHASELLNAQTGELESVSVTFAGLDTIDYRGNMLLSNRYVLTMEDGEITLWYERGSGRWLGLETRTESGRLLRYLPESLPQFPHLDRVPNLSTPMALP